MGIVNYTYNRSTSGGEIITHLINATDGEGLHFDGAAGFIENTSSPDLGSKWSAELIIQADAWGSADLHIVDWSSGERVIIGSKTATDSGKLAFYRGSWVSFGVETLEDLKVHHLVIVVDETANTAILYDNGNQVASITPSGSYNVDDCSTLRLSGDGDYFNGTMYRVRLWNKTLSQAEVTASYENATVPFADQYGSQTNKITGAVDKNWGTAQADTGNDANDRATFNGVYVWTTSGSITDISIASNLLQFTTSASEGLYYNAGIAAGKKYRITVGTGTITGTTFKVYAGGEAAANEVGELVASTTNTFEFTSSNPSNGYIYILAVGAGTIQLNAASVSNSAVEIGCVSDYDLAFANPTQSLMVQDRAGAADGTSSATGVSQITKLEQVNTKAISVSNATQRTPADGTLVADKVGVGVVPRSDWISDLSILQFGEVGALTGGDTGWGGYVEVCANSYRDSGGFKRITADYATLYEQNNANGSHNFKVAATGAAGSAITWSTALTIDSAGNVKISKGHTGTFTALSLGNTNSSANDNVALELQAAGLGAPARIEAEAPGGSDTDLAFYTVNGGVAGLSMRLDADGPATFANGIAVTTGGIKFPATQSASADANTLDDYEEGSWTPAYTPQTNAFTSITYVGAIPGRYTKIGNMVTVWGYIGTDAITVGTASGAVYLTGLPFAQATVGAGNFQNGVGADKWGTNNVTHIQLSSGEQQFGLFYRTSSTVNETAVNVTDMSTGGDANYTKFVFSYRV